LKYKLRLNCVNHYAGLNKWRECISWIYRAKTLGVLCCFIQADVIVYSHWVTESKHLKDR